MGNLTGKAQPLDKGILIEMLEEEKNKEMPQDIAKLSYAVALHQIMERENIPLKALASDTDVKLSTIWGHAQGQSDASISALYKVASKYPYFSADYLIGIDDEPAPDLNLRAVKKKTGLTHETQRAIKKLNDSEHGKADMAILNFLFETQFLSRLIEQFRESIQLTEYLKLAATEDNEKHKRDIKGGSKYLEWRLHSFITAMYAKLIDKLPNSKYYDDIIKEGLDYLDDDIWIALYEKSEKKRVDILLEQIDPTEDVESMNVAEAKISKTKKITEDSKAEEDSEMVISHFLRKRLGVDKK